MSQLLNVSELHFLLSKYIRNDKFRAKIVFRAKRSLRFQGKNDQGMECCGWDQCYLTGAINLLKNLNDVDFILLHSGKIAQVDMERTKHIARTSISKMPWFLTRHSSLVTYKKLLREMYIANIID